MLRVRWQAGILPEDVPQGTQMDEDLPDAVRGGTVYLRHGQEIRSPRTYRRRSLPERLGKRLLIDLDGPLVNDSPCWIDSSARDRQSYGTVWVDGKTRLTHRATYELWVGPIPEGLDIDHLCHVQACCNPAHLEPVTRAANLRRGRAWSAERLWTP